jgi:hypothetical protein
MLTSELVSLTDDSEMISQRKAAPRKNPYDITSAYMIKAARTSRITKVEPKRSPQSDGVGGLAPLPVGNMVVIRECISFPENKVLFYSLTIMPFIFFF